MEHTVADRGDLIGAGDHAMVLILQGIHDHLDRHLMIGHGIFHNELILACRLMGQLRTLDADPLTQAFCDHALIGHIDQLIFQGRTPTVYY